jgi:hypothetical protein
VRTGPASACALCSAGPPPARSLGGTLTGLRAPKVVIVLVSILGVVGAKRATWLLIAGQGISSVGTGVVVPLTLIYLHQVRGIPLPVAAGGLVWAHSTATALPGDTVTLFALA